MPQLTNLACLDCIHHLHLYALPSQTLAYENLLLCCKVWWPCPRFTHSIVHMQACNPCTKLPTSCFVSTTQPASVRCHVPLMALRPLFHALPKPLWAWASTSPNIALYLFVESLGVPWMCPHHALTYALWLPPSEQPPTPFLKNVLNNSQFVGCLSTDNQTLGISSPNGVPIPLLHAMPTDHALLIILCALAAPSTAYHAHPCYNSCHLTRFDPSRRTELSSHQCTSPATYYATNMFS